MATKQSRLHGRVEGARARCAVPGCTAPGEYKAPLQPANFDGPGAWRFTVLNLATMRETPLAETESIDDQIEWIDGDRLVYGKAGSLWTVRSDGTGTPELFAANALSPAVIRE